MILSPAPFLKFFDNSGVPLTGGKLFTYVAGTSTKQVTYSDSAGSTQNANPIILDSRGECSCWLDTNLTYKFVLSPANDTDPPTNPIKSIDSISFQINYTQFKYDQISAEAAASAAPVNYFREPGDARRMGAVTDLTTNDASAFVKLLDQCKRGFYRFFLQTDINAGGLKLAASSQCSFVGSGQIEHKGGVVEGPASISREAE